MPKRDEVWIHQLNPTVASQLAEAIRKGKQMAAEHITETVDVLWAYASNIEGLYWGLEGLFDNPFRSMSDEFWMLVWRSYNYQNKQNPLPTPTREQLDEIWVRVVETAQERE